MKDDFRWYNTAYFKKREEMMKNWPEEKERIFNDERMIPHLRYEEEEKQRKEAMALKKGMKFILIFDSRGGQGRFQLLCVLSEWASGHP